MEPLDKKWEDFGFNTIVINGHSVPEILDVFEKAKANKKSPTCIIAKTIKGKGVSFLADTRASHSLKLNAEQYKQALCELRGSEMYA